MYKQITDENPYEQPMRIYPAPHYTMGGLWVDYNLMTNIPGLYAIGEANFSDHGSNRLGASALMQGLCDGYFVLPYTIGDYLAQITPGVVDESEKEFVETKEQVADKLGKIASLGGKKTVDSYHKRLGRIMWDKCGMSRSEQGLKEAISDIQELREDFWKNASVPGASEGVNQVLERAARVADFLEFGELMCVDALDRKESCGGHFREESQTKEGEALRNDNDYSYVSAWGFNGVGKEPTLHRENLEFENVKLTQRSYK